MVASVDRLTSDLADAYPIGARVSWERDVLLHRGRAVTIPDSWKLPATSAPAVGRLDLVLAGDLSLLDDDCVMHAPEGVGSVGICWDGSVAAAVVEHVALDDSMLREAWGRRLSRLTLTLHDAPSGRVTVQTVELVPEGQR